jgi:hypothetical protein
LAAVALAAATPKSVLAVIGTANFGVNLKKIDIGFDGVTASAIPGLVELCRSTQAGAGTSTTAGTPTQVGGTTITPGFTAQYAYTVEPTVLTVVRSWLITPTSSEFTYDFPLGDEPDTPVSGAFILRCTFPAIVNCRAGMTYERT